MLGRFRSRSQSPDSHVGSIAVDEFTAVVRVVEARGLRIGDKKNKSSDPYVQVSVFGKNKTFKSKVLSKTVTPKWDEEFEFGSFGEGQKKNAAPGVREDEHILIQVLDKDLVFSQDLGAVAIAVGDVAKEPDMVKKEWLKLRPTAAVTSELKGSKNKDKEPSPEWGQVLVEISLRNSSQVSPDSEEEEKQEKEKGKQREQEQMEESETASRKSRRETASVVRSVRDDGGETQVQAQDEKKSLEPGSDHLLVKVIQARGLRAADRNGKSDPYCVVTMGKGKKKTKVVKKTLEPRWDQELELPTRTPSGAPIEKDLEIKVFDDDFIGDDSLGQVTIAFSDLKELDGDAAVWYPLGDGSAKKKKKNASGEIQLLIRYPRSQGSRTQEAEPASPATPASQASSPKRSFLSRVRSFSPLSRGSSKSLGKEAEATGTRPEELEGLPTEVPEFTLTVLGARGLRAADKNGLSDPYVVLRMDREKFKTKTIKKTLDPEWEEQFTFGAKSSTRSSWKWSDKVDIKVYDADTFTSQLIGAVEVSVVELFRLSLAQAETKWFDLAATTSPKAGGALEAGSIELSASFVTAAHNEESVSSARNAPLKESRGKEASAENSEFLPEYSIKILQAKGLKATDRGNSCDPYVVITYRTSKGKSKTLSTKVVKRTLEPSWENEEFPLEGLHVSGEDSEESSGQILVKVMDKDLIMSDLVGKATLSVRDFARSRGPQWVSLEPQGSLQVELSVSGEIAPSASQPSPSSINPDEVFAKVRKQLSDRREGISSLRVAFQMQQHDGSDSVDMDGLASIFRFLKISVSQGELDALFSVLDEDRNNRIVFDEFEELVIGGDHSSAKDQNRASGSKLAEEAQQSTEFKSPPSVSQCGVDPVNAQNTRLVVRLIRGEGLRAADRGNKSDPFCVLKLGKETKSSKVCKATLAPEWGEEFVFGNKSGAGLRPDDELKVTVKDKDLLLSDLLGEFKVPLSSIAHNNAEQRWFPLSGKGASGRVCVVLSLSTEDSSSREEPAVMKTVDEFVAANEPKKDLQKDDGVLPGSHVSKAGTSNKIVDDSASMEGQQRLLAEIRDIIARQSRMAMALSKPSLSDTLEQLDVRQQGYLSVKRLNDGLASFGAKLSSSQLSTLLPRVDPEGIDQVDYRLFCKVVRADSSSRTPSSHKTESIAVIKQRVAQAIAIAHAKRTRIVSLFQAFDLSSSGRVTDSDAAAAFRALGANFEASELILVAKQLPGAERHGSIEYVPFIRGLAPDIDFDGDELATHTHQQLVLSPRGNTVVGPPPAHSELTFDQSLACFKRAIRLLESKATPPLDILRFFEQQDMSGTGLVSSRCFADFVASEINRNIALPKSDMISDSAARVMAARLEKGRGQVDYSEFARLVSMSTEELEMSVERIRKTLAARTQSPSTSHRGQFSLLAEFSKVDRGGSGVVTRRVLRSVVSRALSASGDGSTMNNAEAAFLLDRFDTFNSGEVSYMEFIDWVHGMPPSSAQAQLSRRNVAAHDVDRVLRAADTQMEYTYPLHRQQSQRERTAQAGPLTHAMEILRKSSSVDESSAVDLWHPSTISEWLNKYASPSERADFDEIYHAVSGQVSKNLILSNDHYGRRSPSPTDRSAAKIGWACRGCGHVNHGVRNLNDCGKCKGIRSLSSKVIVDSSAESSEDASDSGSESPRSRRRSLSRSRKSGLHRRWVHERSSAAGSSEETASTASESSESSDQGRRRASRSRHGRGRSRGRPQVLLSPRSLREERPSKSSRSGSKTKRPSRSRSKHAHRDRSPSNGSDRLSVTFHRADVFHEDFWSNVNSTRNELRRDESKERHKKNKKKERSSSKKRHGKKRSKSKSEKTRKSKSRHRSRSAKNSSCRAPIH